MEVLCKELLINVTLFFRDREAFEELDQHIVQPLVENSTPDQELRIWCAGCATGEEAFSIAILFQEAMERSDQHRSVKIFATDVDQTVIVRAGAGVFGLSIREDLSKSRLTKYFRMEGEHYRISSEIRQMVVFANHDITRDPPFSSMDLVVCRNLLIYLRQEVQQQVLSQLHFAVKQAGCLFLGSSENLGALNDEFEALSMRSRLYRKVRATRLQPVNTQNLDRATNAVERLSRQARRNRAPDPVRVAALALTERFSPPGLLVNDQDDVLHIFGDASPFLRKPGPGALATKVSALVIEPLQVVISTAIHRARERREDVIYTNVRVTDDNGVDDSLDIRVCFDADPADTGSYLTVVFAKQRDLDRNQDESARVSFDERGQMQARIDDLEHELKDTREHLQVTVEELETTNEELQSSNEELLAANEELQSTNEELQSVNEELFTVNAEFQEKIQELTDVNSDLDNVLTYADIALVLLDNQLTIKRYSRSAVSYFNLRDADTGRPVAHVTHMLDYDDLQVDIAHTARAQNPMSRVVRTDTGTRVRVSIAPYRKQDGQRDGLLITILDVTTQYLADVDALASGDLEDPTALMVQRVGRIGVLRWDYEHDTVALNAQMHLLLDTDTARFGGRLSELVLRIAVDDRNRFREWIEQLSDASRATGGLTVRSATERFIKFEGQGIIDKSGKPAQALCVATDVTAERALDARLKRLATPPVERYSRDMLSVLLIDDSDEDSELISKVLAQFSAADALTRVATLEELSDAVDTGFYDVVLLDLSLPDSVGADTVTRVVYMMPDTPIVVVTGSSSDVLLMDCIARGADDWLVKDDLTPDSLEHSVRKALARRRLAITA